MPGTAMRVMVDKVIMKQVPGRIAPTFGADWPRALENVGGMEVVSEPDGLEVRLLDAAGRRTVAIGQVPWQLIDSAVTAQEGQE